MGARKAVVIDDSGFLAREIAEFLSAHMGLEVAAVGRDGNDAVRLYREHRPDLITMDLTMPNKGYVEKPLKFSNPAYIEEFKLSLREAMGG